MLQTSSFPAFSWFTSCQSWCNPIFTRGLTSRGGGDEEQLPRRDLSPAVRDGYCRSPPPPPMHPKRGVRWSVLRATPHTHSHKYQPMWPDRLQVSFAGGRMIQEDERLNTPLTWHRLHYSLEVSWHQMFSSSPLLNSSLLCSLLWNVWICGVTL